MLFAKTNKQTNASTHSQQVYSSNQDQTESFVTPFHSRYYWFSFINCKETTGNKEALKLDAKENDLQEELHVPWEPKRHLAQKALLPPI